ncbi:MAG: cytochrome c [Acidobacteria bacterium]|nr:cytochrome c [Acidobacteriota bacterium]
MLTKLTAIAVFVLGLALAVQSVSTSQVSAQSNKNDRGQQLFQQYCASCHGVDGKGGGPVAASLKNPIPDLTMIEKRDGKYDQLKVQNIISGEYEIAAHGKKDMPVWGYIFKQKTGSAMTSRLQIYALGTYLKSIQAK